MKKKVIVIVILLFIMIGLLVFLAFEMNKNPVKDDQSVGNSDQLIHPNIDDSEEIISSELDDTKQEGNNNFDEEENSIDEADQQKSDSGIADSIFDDVPVSTPATQITPNPETTVIPEETIVPSEPVIPDELDYIGFQNLSSVDQQAHMDSFEDLDAFFEWYNSVKEKYEKENPPIEVDGGKIDIGSIIEGEN